MRILAARGEVLPAEKDGRLVTAMANFAMASIETSPHDPNAYPRYDKEDQQQPTRDGGTPPRDEMHCTYPNHGTQRRHQAEQYAAPPRCGKPFQPAKILSRGPSGLGCRHLEGRDLFEILIKKRCGAITDDAHRVRETIRRIGIVEQLLDIIAPTDKVRDEIRQPCNRNGSKNYTGRTHTQTVRGEPRSSGDLERCVARNGCDGCCASVTQRLPEAN